MTDSQMTKAQVTRFLDAVFEAIYDTASEHQVSDALATVLVMGGLIHDCHVGGTGPLLRRYIDATLAELDAPPDTEGDAGHLTQVAIARHQASEALVLAIAQAMAVDLETTVLPGHGPRPN